MLHRFMMFDHIFLRFIVVGVINTIVGGALIFLLYNIVEIGYWLSSMVSYVLISILSFILNKYFTFGIRYWSAFMIIAFVFTIMFSYLAAYGIAKPVMNYLLKNSPQRIRENVALFIGMCLFTGINYLGQRFIVFKQKKKNNNEKIGY